MVSIEIAQTTPQPGFAPAQRTNRALTAGMEKQALLWMARRAPDWLSSDQLTLLGLAGQVGAGITYALARYSPGVLPLVALCMLLNWLGDSLDGTLARVRGTERPRYGFYVDHAVDILGSVALLCGLGCSGFLHPQIAAALLVAFLLLASESYLATYTLGRFELSQGPFGPTELRLLLVAGTLALLRSPYCTVRGHKLLLFDLGGVIAVGCMGVLALGVMVRHTVQLSRMEPLPCAGSRSTRALPAPHSAPDRSARCSPHGGG